RNRQDISPETLEKYMGEKVWVNPDNKNDFEISGKLTEEWYYGLDSMSPETPGEKPDELMFVFNDQTHSGADMSPVCVPLADFSEPLIAAGFTAGQRCNRHGTQDIWYFTRDAIGVRVSLRGKSKPLDTTQTCVLMVIISVLS
ncbi:MAG: hypothetical protein LBE22_05830, partial [Azoarcus sp.]|nr:hypothetical protein [Azoarcus sp.]